MEILDRLIPGRQGRRTGPARVPELRLTVDSQTLCFPDPEAFEFAISPRVSVPAQRLARLMGQSTEALAEEAERARAAQRTLVMALERDGEDTGALLRAVRRVGLRAFSNDHGWRELVAALMDQPAGMAPYQRLALATYARYLGERVAQCEILRQALHQAGEDGPMAMHPRLLETREPVHATALITAGSARVPPAPFERLPWGRPVRLRLPDDGGALWLRLAEHHFALHPEAPPRLIDPHGQELPLAVGRSQVIGRHTGCNVVVDAHYTSLSRRHLSISIRAGGEVVATDLSAHGTFVPRGHIEPLD